jgi:hypothetical protein
LELIGAFAAAAAAPQRLSAAFTVFIVMVADYTWLSTWPPLRDP